MYSIFGRAAQAVISLLCSIYPFPFPPSYKSTGGLKSITCSALLSHRPLAQTRTVKTSYLIRHPRTGPALNTSSALRAAAARSRRLQGASQPCSRHRPSSSKWICPRPSDRPMVWAASPRISLPGSHGASAGEHERSTQTGVGSSLCPCHSSIRRERGAWVESVAHSRMQFSKTSD